MIMLNRIILFLSAMLFSSILFGQGPSSKKLPIKYRLLMTSVSVEDVNPDEISISLNAFNTGRNPIEFSDFDAIPNEMEIKFEESFYRSSLSNLEEQITASLIKQNLSIPNGKILRNLRFNLPCNEILYKQLTKKEKRFSKNYSPNKRNKAPALKYKTSDRKESPLPTFLTKKDKKKTFEKKSKKEQEIEVAVIEKKEKVKTSKISSPKKTTKKIEKDIAVVEDLISVPEKAVDDVPDSTVSASSIDQKTEKIKNNKKQNIGVVIEEKSKKKISILEKKRNKKKEEAAIKNDSYKIEKASEQEEQKVILEALGVNDQNKKETVEEKQNNLFNKADDEEDEGVAFDTQAGVNESKNSYAEKAVCPDLILDNLTIIKKSSKWVTLEYTLTNIGKGPAYLDIKGSQGIALRAFLSSSENISRGALPLGGGFVSYDDEVTGKELFPDSSFTGTLKLDIRKMTRFTPFVILNFDPFNALDECDKTNNYGNIKIGG